MARFSLVGPSYSSQSLIADCQRTVNWYPETIESGQGKSAVALYPTPGLSLFATLPAMNRVMGECYCFGRLFAVGENPAGQVLFEISAAGGVTNRGNLGPAGSMASLAYNQASPAQLLIASGGSLFLLNLGTNALTQIDTSGGPALQGPVSQVGFSDGYFIATLQNSAKFQISKLLDGSSWDPTFIAEISVFPDNIVSMVVDHRELAFGGAKQSIAYYDSGNPLFPYDPVPGAFVEEGSAATWAPVKMDNSIFWLSQDERGYGIARKVVGYTPGRVSNHAIEFAWSKGTISDAIGYSYQDQGHIFWVLYFPTLDQTWVYDAATQSWHERAYLDPVSGNFHAHRSQCHAFAYSKHLVGDYAAGNIYDMSINYLTDFGNPIQRLRRSPHVSTENQRMYHNEVILDLEPGIGPQPPLTDGAGNPRGPIISMRFSNDGAKTWSNYYDRDYGQAGKYGTRARWLRLGQARDRVYEFTTADPVACRIIDGYLMATPGYNAVERLPKSLGKMA